MSDRAAKLLLEVAGYVRMEADRGEFRRLGAVVSIHPRLASEILQWSRGYREHLAHVMERKEGIRRAKIKTALARDAMRDEEALERVRAMVEDLERGQDAKELADRALKIGLIGPKETI